MLGASQARQRGQEEQQRLAEQTLVQQYAQSMQPQQVQPGQEYVPGPTPSPPAIVKGIDVRPENEREEPFNFEGGFAPGIRSNLANAAITALGAIEPAYNTAVGVGARLLPGDQEFDKQFRNVMEERAEQGKGAGIRQFFAAGTEAARRAQPMQQGSEIFSSWAMPWLDMLGNAGIPQETLDQFQELREQYFEEETGEKWDDTGFFRNATADIRASRRAYKDINLPKYYKGTMEVALDPLNLIPGAGWVNDAKAVTKIATLSAKGAVKLPSAVMNSPKMAVSAKTRILETWRMAHEVPEESLNLSEIRRKQDAATAIADEMMALPNAAWEGEGSTGRFIESFVTELTGSSKQKRAAIDAIEAEIGYRTTSQTAGAFDYIEPIIIGNRADDRTAQGSRFFDDADSATDAQRRVDTSDELNELADANLRSGQASKVQDALRGIYNILPEAIQMPFTGVINAITPRLIAKIDVADLNTERIKSALINANLQNRAAVVVNQIQAVTGSAKQVFGEKINNSIITLDSATGATVKRALIARYKEMTGLTPRQIDEALEGAADFSFHESDLINAVVDVSEVRLSNGAVTIVYDIADNFKKADSPFFQNNQITQQGNYLIQRAKAYGEFAKLLDESGIPIGVTADGAEIMLRGKDRIKRLMNDGAFASRFVWSKSNGALNGVADATFEKYYNKARTLLDPDDLRQWNLQADCRHCSRRTLNQVV